MDGPPRRTVIQAGSEVEDCLQAARAWAVSVMEAIAQIEKETAAALQLLAAGSEQEVVSRQLTRVRDAIRVLASCPGCLEAQLDRRDNLRQLRPNGETSLLAEPLTARQLRVLKLLRGTLTLCEIGQDLGVSRNTIKSHTQAIYRKLGVADRRDAIQRGYDLGILLSVRKVSVATRSGGSADQTRSSARSAHDFPARHTAGRAWSTALMHRPDSFSKVPLQREKYMKTGRAFSGPSHA